MKFASLASFALALGCLSACGSSAGTGAPGAKGDPGVKGDPGNPGEVGASIGAVAPLGIFLDRTSAVEISGVGTSWADGVKVDFGMGVTVDKVTVASPTSLVATVTVKDVAALGSHDVTVDDGKKPIAFKGAFHVDAPLFPDTLSGTQAQGSLLRARLVQKDVKTPFDDGINLTAAGTTPGQLLAVAPYALDAILFVDVTTKAGTIDLGAVSADAKPITSRAPGALTVVERKPTPLGTMTPISGKIMTAFESQLFQLDADANQIVKVTLASKDPKFSPGFALLPSTGSFADMLGFGPNQQVVTSKKDTFFVVVWDGKGGSGYDFDLTAKTRLGNLEKEQNDTYQTANVVQNGIPMFAAITPASDVDYYAISINSGQQITATVKAGDTDTCAPSGKIDSLLTLYSTNGTTVITSNEDINANNYCSSVSQNILVTGTYYLKVDNSAFCTSCTFNYSLEVTVKP